MNVKLSTTKEYNFNTTRDIIKNWGSVFGASDVAKDGEQLEPFLSMLDRTLSVFKTDKERFISFLTDTETVDLMQPQGPFQLSVLKKIEFEKRDDEAYLVGDPENKPFDNDRLLKFTQLIASMTIPCNANSFENCYLSAAGLQKSDFQVFPLVVADDKSDDNETTMLVFQSNPLALKQGNSSKTDNDCRPSTVIIGNGPISDELQNCLASTSEAASKNVVSYIDASNKVDVDQLVKALGRDNTFKPQLISSLSALLDRSEHSASKVSGEANFTSAAVETTGSANDLNAKILSLLKAGMMGDALRVGYVAISTPTRTAELLNGLKNTFVTRPNSNRSKPSGTNGLEA